MRQLLDANAIPLPQTMIDQEIEYLAKQVHFSEKAKEQEQFAALKTELFESEARRRVALGLIISRLMSTQGIKLDETRVDDQLTSIASTYQESEKVVQWYRNNPIALGGVRAIALEDQMVDWLLERAVVVEKPSNFDEIMKSRKAVASFQE
jgi:trigger factor